MELGFGSCRTKLNMHAQWSKRRNGVTNRRAKLKVQKRHVATPRTSLTAKVYNTKQIKGITSSICRALPRQTLNQIVHTTSTSSAHYELHKHLSNIDIAKFFEIGRASCRERV